MKTFILILSGLLFACYTHAQDLTLNVKVLQSADDAEERQDSTNTDIASSDLELVVDGSKGNQTIGIRFDAVNLPSDATIKKAYIQFVADGDFSEATNLWVKGELNANPNAFVAEAKNITSRKTTTAKVDWNEMAAWTDGESGVNQQTPDLTAILNEVISSTGWQKGNSLCFIISGTGKRRAVSFDGNADNVAKLVIEYTPSTAIYKDLAVVAIAQPESNINTSKETTIELVIKNLGLDTQKSFSLSYSLNDGTEVTEMVSSTLANSEELVYSFNQKADLSIAGKYKISAKVSLEGDEVKENDTISIFISAVSDSDSLYFAQGAAWKYLDDGTDQGTTWRGSDFNDSEWKTGTGHMGFGEGDENTVLTKGFITYYFRKKINIPDISKVGEVYFNIVHDDGAVLYINGTEALRSAFMPAGEITYLTGTTTFIPNDVENSFWEYKIDKSLLKEGDNFIAIEVHNQTATSSDVSFDCYVSPKTNIGFNLDGPYVFYRDEKVVVKTVESDGPHTYTYNTPEEAKLVCRFPDGTDSFTVAIRPTKTIDPCEYPMPEKFFAISDIEGNLEGFAMFLKDAGIMDDGFNWIFGNGHLFFVGDMFDRGPNVTECLWLVYRLEQQAEAAGGKIHFIMGNHDIMNLIFDFRYVAQKYLNNMPLIEETLESIYSRDTELGRWLRTKNFIEKAEKVIFVHGGLSPAVQKLGLSFSEMNYYGRYRIDSACQNKACSTINGGSEIGLYWYRGMSNQLLTQNQVDSILYSFNGNQIVVGHTVFDDITLLYNNSVVAIDLEHSANYTNGYMSALYGTNNKLYRFKTTGTDTTYTYLGTITSLESETASKPVLNSSVYPNPTNGKSLFSFNVPSESIGKAAKLSIYSIDGKHIAQLEKVCLLKNENIQIDLSHLAAGIYNYTLTLGNNVEAHKIVISK